jgi:cholesterol transport system auxiliary component
VRASRAFEATSAVSGSGNDAYIAALDRGFAKAADELVGWALAAM